jgi:hypothetical protein
VSVGSMTSRRHSCAALENVFLRKQLLDQPTVAHELDRRPVLVCNTWFRIDAHLGVERRREILGTNTFSDA